MTFEPFSFQMCDIKQEYAYFILDKIVPVSGTFAEYDRLMRQYLIYYGDKDYITIHLPFPADPEPVSVKKEPVCDTPATPPVAEVETPKAPAKTTRERSTRNRVQPKRLFADETEKKEEDVPVRHHNKRQRRPLTENLTETSEKKFERGGGEDGSFSRKKWKCGTSV